MECPRCGLIQPDAEICTGCGINVQKYLASTGQAPAGGPAAAEPVPPAPAAAPPAPAPPPYTPAPAQARQIATSAAPLAKGSHSFDKACWSGASQRRAPRW